MLAVKYYLLEIVVVAFRLLASLDALGVAGAVLRYDPRASPTTSEEPGGEEGREVLSAEEHAHSEEGLRKEDTEEEEEDGIGGFGAFGAGVGIALRRVDATSGETKKFLESVTKHTRQVVGGTTAGVVGVAGVLLGHVAGLAQATTWDDEYQERQQLLRQRHPENTRQGLIMGLEALRDGFSSASAGVVRKPMEGAHTGGVAGMLWGLQRGLRGLCAKPLAATAVAATKATEGIASDVMRATHATVLDQHMRMRQPRMLGVGHGARILPYPVVLPQIVLTEAKGAKDVMDTATRV